MLETEIYLSTVQDKDIQLQYFMVRSPEAYAPGSFSSSMFTVFIH